MQYEKTGKKSASSKDAADEGILTSVSTSKMLWVAIRRHKFGLVSAYAIWMTIIYFMPFLPGEIISLIKSV